MYACFYCKRQLYVAILNKLIIIIITYYYMSCSWIGYSSIIGKNLAIWLDFNTPYLNQSTLEQLAI